MKRTALILAVLVLSAGLQGNREVRPAAGAEENPFFTAWNTPFQTPPFDKIKDEHYRPAFQAGMAQQKEEVEAIVNNPQPPTFANTVEALEQSGGLLTKVSNIFFNLTSANTNEEMQKIEAEVSPLLAKHNDDIFLNPKLFVRLKAVYEQKDQLNLTPEQRRLLDKFYRSFVRGGANLDQARQAQLRKINEELAVLTAKFGENVLKEDNAFTLDPGQSGGPGRAAPDRSSTARPRRPRQRAWKENGSSPCTSRAASPFSSTQPGAISGKSCSRLSSTGGTTTISSTTRPSCPGSPPCASNMAQLLGYKTHADFVLEENMAKNPAAVFKLLDQLWKPSLEMAKKEASELQALIDQEGGKFKLEPWDWWYYAEKLKKAKYELDDEILRPYFKLENVRDGAFEVAHRLWGLQFVERTDIPIYHPEVKVFEVKEADGRSIGILYTDYFPRPSKQAAPGPTLSESSRRARDHFVTPLV